jgi:hypothetical protein
MKDLLFMLRMKTLIQIRGMKVRRRRRKEPEDLRISREHKVLLRSLLPIRWSRSTNLLLSLQRPMNSLFANLVIKLGLLYQPESSDVSSQLLPKLTKNQILT